MLNLHSFLQKLNVVVIRLLRLCYKSSVMIITGALLAILVTLGTSNLGKSGQTNVIAANHMISLEGYYILTEETENAANIQTKVNNPLIETSSIIKNTNFKLLSTNIYTGKTVNYQNVLNLVDKSTVLNEKNLLQNTTINKDKADNKTEIKKKTKDKKTKDNNKGTSNSKTKDKATVENKVVEAFAVSTDNAITKTTDKTVNKLETAVRTLTKTDYTVLLRIVEAEATGEDIKGKILVANVVLNRVDHSQFPNTVEKVVFQKNGNTVQFSPTKDGRYWSVTVSKETEEAVKRALSGEDYSQGALFFSARSKADKNSMSWFDNNLKWLFKHGGHEFYTVKK